MAGEPKALKINIKLPAVISDCDLQMIACSTTPASPNEKDDEA